MEILSVGSTGWESLMVPLLPAFLYELKRLVLSHRTIPIMWLLASVSSPSGSQGCQRIRYPFSTHLIHIADIGNSLPGTCVWPQLAFSCFHCTKSTTTLTIIGTENRQPGYDFISKPWWHQVTLVLTCLHEQAWVQAPCFSQQLQRLCCTNLRGLSTCTWSAQQHIIVSEPPHVLPKTSCYHTSLTESASHLFSVYVISEPPQPQLTAAQASLPGTKVDSTKRKGKGEKKMQQYFSFTYSWLYQHSQNSSQQRWAKRPCHCSFECRRSVQFSQKKGVFLCTKNVFKEPLVPL